MYKIILFFIMNISLFAEIPINFNYQAIAVNSGTTVSNANIAVQFKLSEQDGTVLYTENNSSVPTDNRGFFSLVFGTNTVVSGDLNSSSFNRALKLVVEADYNTSDGITYTQIAERQLNSVPYAVGALSSQSGGGMIGDVKTSLLNFSQFAAIVSDPSTFDASVSQWAPADGTTITGSKYASITGQTTLPDLRGMFVRGLNDFTSDLSNTRVDGYQDVNTSRTAGSVQEDSFQGHNHGGGSGTYMGTTAGGTTNYSQPSTNTTSWYTSGITELTGYNSPRYDLETRPKNVAVYYYIKIN